jgi:hypothetical protein
MTDSTLRTAMIEGGTAMDRWVITNRRMKAVWCGTLMLATVAGSDTWLRAESFEGDLTIPSVLADATLDGLVVQPTEPPGSEAGASESVMVADGASDGSFTPQSMSSCVAVTDGVSACGTMCGGCGTCSNAWACGHGCHDSPGLFQFLRQCHDKNNACWMGRADALVLWRNAPSSRPLFSTVTPETQQLGPTALNASDLNSDVLVAPRLSLFRTDCDGQTLEATYLYAGNFFSERSLPYSPNGYATSPPGIYGNNWGPPDTNLDSANAQLLGQLQSLEFNARHCIWADTCQFLVGARWLQWNETLQMNDSFFYTDPTPISGQDFYETRCFNNLWGGQIGLDTLLLGRPGMARVEGLVKAGAYYNATGQASRFKYVLSDGYNFENQARADGLAACSFVGELGLTAVLPICCNWDFRCGYFGLWLTNLAQPTKQLSDQDISQFDSVAGLNSAGSVILQGLSLGLEGRW